MDKEDTISCSDSSESDEKQQPPRLFESIHAGFPSPAEDIPGTALDINRLVVKNPASTFFARVSGDSMEGDGIRERGHPGRRQVRGASRRSHSRVLHQRGVHRQKG